MFRKFACVLLVGCLMLSGCEGDLPENTPAPTDVVAPTPSPTPSETPTASPTPPEVIAPSDNSDVTTTTTWSPNGRYVAIYESHNRYRTTTILDTQTMEYIEPPRLNELLDFWGDNFGKDFIWSNSFFDFLKWVADDKVKIGFSTELTFGLLTTTPNASSWYIYDLSKRTIEEINYDFEYYD
jgi:hypothetical protein